MFEDLRTADRLISMRDGALVEETRLTGGAAAGAATLTLGLALGGTTTNPYARTKAATNGPDVVASVVASIQPGGPGATADASELTALEHASGVVAHSGPFPLTWASLPSALPRSGCSPDGWQDR
jgi:hypothetical protein